MASTSLSTTKLRHLFRSTHAKLFVQTNLASFDVWVMLLECYVAANKGGHQHRPSQEEEICACMTNDIELSLLRTR